MIVDYHHMIIDYNHMIIDFRHDDDDDVNPIHHHI